MPSRALVVDANILVRAVLGTRVRDVIASAANVSFFVPETAFVEAEEHVVALALKRGGDPEIALAFLRSLSHLVELLGCEVYGAFRGGSPGTAGQARPRRLANPGVRAGARMSHLDRRYRFLRMRGRHLDNGQGSDVPA
jgi:hypothetical protein